MDDPNDPPPTQAAADTNTTAGDLPPMPDAAPPVPPPAAFDPLASSPADYDEPPAAPLSEDIDNNPINAGGDTDLLGTGLDASVAAPAAPAPPPPQPAWSNAVQNVGDGAGTAPATNADNNDEDEDSSEYETDDDDDEDDDMIVGFPTRRYSSDGDEGAEDNNLLGMYDGAAAAAELQAHQQQVNPESDEYVEPTDDLLRPGDHVYSWVQKKQRHGIVLSVGDGVLTEVDPNDCDRDAVTIVYFYTKENRDRRAEDGADDAADAGYASLATGDVGEINDEGLLSGDDNAANSGSNSNGEANDSVPISGYAANATAISLATFCGGSTKKNAVRKVRYGSNFAKRLLSRPGSVTAVKADVPGLVLARVKFLLENPGVLPPYHRMAANGECAAVWCRIGRFITLQGSSILQIMFFGQAGGAVGEL